jgi:LPXTG-motif cell wall-anchored protein
VPSTSHELPATGTKEVLSTLVILALFSGTVVSYVRSRRPSLSL